MGFLIFFFYTIEARWMVATDTAIPTITARPPCFRRARTDHVLCSGRPGNDYVTIDRRARTKILNQFNNPTVHSVVIRVFTILWAIIRRRLAEYKERLPCTTRWTHGEVNGAV